MDNKLFRTAVQKKRKKKKRIGMKRKSFRRRTLSVDDEGMVPRILNEIG
jgi:hypothetical protein